MDPSKPAHSGQPASSSTPFDDVSVKPAGDPSARKKVIKPINDLDAEKERLSRLIQEEEAREKEQTPGAAVAPLADGSAASEPIVDEQQIQADEQAVTELIQPHEEDELAAPAAGQPAPAVDAIQSADTLQAQKAEIQQEIQAMVDQGVIDQEAAAPAVGGQPDPSAPEIDLPAPQNPQDTSPPPPAAPPRPPIDEATRQAYDQDVAL